MHTHHHAHMVVFKAITFCRKKLPLLGCSLLFFATCASAEGTAEPGEISTEVTTKETSTPPSEKNTKAKSEVEELVVVGSRIRRDSLKSISPVVFVTRDEIIAAGFTSATELLQGSKVAGGNAQINNAYGGYVTNGGPGSNTISLRGLGEGRTLVLINGRRVAPAGSRGAVGSADLNVLPSAMIEHIEVLHDGASAIYGSDAIGGVINVITMESVDGLNLESDVHIPTEGDGEQYRFSVSGGYSEDRLSLTGSFDYYERKNLTLADRDWTRCNTDNIRDPETGESLDFIDPKTGKPKCYPITGTGSNGVTVNTIGTQQVRADNWEALGLNGPAVGAPGSSGTTFTRFRPNPLITTGVIGFEGVGGGSNSLNVRDTFDPRMLEENLISPSKVYTTFLQGKYELQSLGDAKAYFEFLANRRDSDQRGFRQLSMDYRLGSPLIPDELSYGNFGPDQGTSDGERVGVRAFVGFGNDNSNQTVDFIKPILGLKGDFFIPDWKYDAYISNSKSEAKYTMESFLTDKLIYASDVVTATGDVDPSLVRNGLTCGINLTDTNEHCIPFPPLNTATISGNLPQDFKDYIFREIVGNTAYEESVFSATIDGPVLSLPAGQAQVALGVEYREARINDKPDPNSMSGNLYNLTISAPTKGKDNVTELYSEIEIPVLADMFLAEELTLNGSLRYTDYDSYGSDSTYKIGLIYSPTDWISFRGTTGTSFRAPALFEQYQGATSGFLSPTLDPCNEYGTPGVPQTVVDNCSSELPGQPEYINTSGIEVFSVGGADAGLKAETSDNTTYGIVLQPHISDTTDLAFEFDYFDINIDNGITQAGASAILDSCYNDPNFASDQGFCRLVSRDAASGQLSVSDAYINLATQSARGLDVTVRFEQEVGPGTLLIDLNGTRYYEQSQKLFADDDRIEYNGTLDWPKFSGDVDISYDWNDWRLTYGLDWIGSMDSYAYVEEDPDDSIYDFAVPSYMKHRISVRYQAANWEATLGIRNLTNETPPTISYGVYNRVGNAPLYSGYDYVGREAFLHVQWHY